VKTSLKSNLLAALMLLGSITAPAQVFFEDFGTLADDTTLSTANTDFTYLRLSTTSNSQKYIKAESPGSFSGSSMLLLSQGGSLSGVGVTSGSYTPFSVGTISLSLVTPSTFTGSTLFIGAGTGDTFTLNNAFNGAHLAAGFQIQSSGKLQVRNASNAWADSGVTLSTGTSYDLAFIFNGSTAPVTYGGYSVAAGTTDIFVNGVLVGNDLSIRDAVDASAFRIYMTGSTSSVAYELDNIALYNSASASAIPEPSTYAALFGAVALIGVGIHRRRARAA